MRLEKIIMINRAPFEHLELDFNDENVVIATNQGEPLVGTSSPAGIAYSNVVGRIEGQEIPFLNFEKGFSLFTKISNIFHKA